MFKMRAKVEIFGVPVVRMSSIKVAQTLATGHDVTSLFFKIQLK